VNQRPARGVTARAETLRAARLANAVEVSYPPELPITERVDEIRTAICDHQVVVLAGETGSGKSTQLPKICLELGRGVHGLIGHTQPRRLAARTIAERVASELGSTVGNTVGFAVRFTDRVADHTRVKVMTDGILLAEIGRDPQLQRYDTIIVDEAHERSLNIDFLLGFLHQLLPKRPDLKLIITSATIDTARFAAHFSTNGRTVPIVEVSGRTFPVDVRYRPFGSEDDEPVDQPQAIVAAIEELCATGDGDVLVFCNGEREIHDAADAVREVSVQGRPIEVVPLYARLSAAEQHRVFEPHTTRRVVLSTNVAETSLTVPGVRFVVDTGTARISRYNRRSKVQRLPIEAISQASANQRSGRCGRVAPGIAIRLYAEDDFVARPEYTDPEILRTNLASVILQMMALGLGDITSFPFIEPPDRRTVKDGLTLLFELGAITAAVDGTLTELGRRLARLPLDPKLGRMVLAAEANGCVKEVMIIAAALSIQDPRERPADARDQADQAHARFADDSSDFISVIKLWNHLREKQRELSSSQFRKMCRREFLNYVRIREWQDIFSQLRQVGSDIGLRLNAKEAPADLVHQSLLTGLVVNVGALDERTKDYRGTRNSRFVIAPGSTQSKKKPRWVMAGEIVETNRLYARTVARVQPEWIERAAEHLVTKSHSEPTWERRSGSAIAIERVTLLGLPIVTGRRVFFGRIDPVQARELFVRNALVDGDWENHHAFVAANAETARRVQALEMRARRRDLLADGDRAYAFFDDRIPETVATTATFNQWWKGMKHLLPDFLSLSLEQLLDEAAADVRWEDFPDVWPSNDAPAALSYVHEPGAIDDGVTAVVPLIALPHLRTAEFSWHIAGHRYELVDGLIRTLNKTIRRQLIPIADHVEKFLASADPTTGSLLDALTRYIAHTVGAPVHADEFDLTRLDPHLRMRFEVRGVDGTVIAVGRDLGGLQASLLGRARTALTHAVPGVEHPAATAWTFVDLEHRVTTRVLGFTVHGFPSLVDEGSGVSVRVMVNEQSQRDSMWDGTKRLLALTVPPSRRDLKRAIEATDRLALTAAPGGDIEALLDDAVAAVVDHALTANGGPVFTAGEFTLLTAAVKADLAHASTSVGIDIARTLTTYAKVQRLFDEMQRQPRSPAMSASINDAIEQVARLMRAGFVARTGVARLTHLPRYLDAVVHRLARLSTDPHRDTPRMNVARTLEALYRDALRRAPAGTTGLLDVRWSIEELRVSLFAQHLGTNGPVSEQRIRAALQSATGQDR
jgi:ATP-dependent helicase HrpA